jgi:hypothetical protein
LIPVIDITLTDQAVIDGKFRGSTKSVTVKVPEEIASGLRRMNDTGSVRADEFLPGADLSRSVQIARKLARLGVLTPDPST